MSDLTQQTMLEQFPDNPPMFMKRGPFSYHDPEWIERDLKAAGFDDVDIDTVKLSSRAESADEAARGALLRFADARRAGGIWRRRARPTCSRVVEVGANNSKDRTGSRRRCRRTS